MNYAESALRHFGETLAPEPANFHFGEAGWLRKHWRNTGVRGRMTGVAAGATVSGALNQNVPADEPTQMRRPAI